MWVKVSGINDVLSMWDYGKMMHGSITCSTHWTALRG